MTVPAALKELEKIEMVRLTDNVYHLDHAVTAMQKTIPEAFGLDVANIKLHHPILYINPRNPAKLTYIMSYESQ